MVFVVMFGGGTMPFMVSVRLSAAQIRALASVKVGMVRYLCLKNTVLHICVWCVMVTNISWQ